MKSANWKSWSNRLCLINNHPVVRENHNTLAVSTVLSIPVFVSQVLERTLNVVTILSLLLELFSSRGRLTLSGNNAWFLPSNPLLKATAAWVVQGSLCLWWSNLNDYHMVVCKRPHDIKLDRLIDLNVCFAVFISFFHYLYFLEIWELSNWTGMFLSRTGHWKIHRKEEAVLGLRSLGWCL